MTYKLDEKVQRAFDRLEKPFVDCVKANKGIGFGRMMQIISQMWYDIDPDGAKATGHCYGTLKRCKEKGICYECNTPIKGVDTSTG